MYYVQGTETHTTTKEEEIAKDLRAELDETSENKSRVHRKLDLEINGRLVSFIHHGPARGRGANEGDPMRNWLKMVYWSYKKRELRIPDMIVTGHLHTHFYNTYVQDFSVLHGLIVPSWQRKTRYAWRFAPMDVNDIGMVAFEITAGGEIKMPVPMVMPDRRGTKTVKI